MEQEDLKFKGVVSDVGLVRDGEQFRSFNLTIGVTVKTGKNMGYEEGERLMHQFRKDLLGKDVELVAVTFPCPVCGRAFNTEQGMKQHIRMVHEEKETKGGKKGSSKKTRGGSSKKKTSKAKKPKKNTKSKKSSK